MHILQRIDMAASEDAIRRFETTHATRLPSDYRDFLKTFNGGVPLERVFSMDTPQGLTEDAVHVLLRLNDSSRNYSIDVEWGAYRDRIPSGLMPIASDSLDNLILMAVEGTSVGAVYFWDHELENMDGAPFWDNITPLAESFRAFVESLRPDGA